jgi:TfoX/Sxy family transcriptional regulator of competence genes
MTTYNAHIARKIRDAIAHVPGLSEHTMFGGIAFLLQGNMCCGVIEDRLVVRVGPGAYDELLREPHVRPMDFTGRPLAGFVYVDREGFASQDALLQWIDRSLCFARTLPPRLAL